MELILGSLGLALIIVGALSFANFYQEGRRWGYTNSGSTTLSVGDVVVLTNGIGVVVGEDIIPGATGEIEVRTVWLLPALSTDTFALGEELYWDATNLQLTTTAGAHNKAGLAAATKAAGADYTTGYVDLNKVA